MDFSIAGLNGIEDIDISSSSTLALTYYDKNYTTLQINNLKNLIHFQIPRNTEPLFDSYKLINVSSLNTSLNMNGFINFALKTNKTNSSVHFQLKPENLTASYLALLKFGSSPSLAEQNYDAFKLFCASQNTNYYPFYVNMNQTNGFKGQVNVAIRELDFDEHYSLCISKNVTFLSSLDARKVLNFTGNFWIKAFSSGCYYYDEKTSSWAAKGVDVLETTSTKYTQCISEHLTEFAGGFVVLPAEIDFSYVFAHASFAQNPFIYSTVIVICVFYLILAVLCRFYDKKDELKVGLTYLNMRYSRRDEYFYEASVFTGSRRNAGTGSNVFMSVYGDLVRSEVLYLHNSGRKLFSRGGIDSFIFSNIQ